MGLGMPVPVCWTGPAIVGSVTLWVCLALWTYGGSTALAGERAGAGSAGSPNPPPSAAAVEFFERRVRPVLVEHCYECHSGDPSLADGRLVLDVPSGLARGGRGGPIVDRERPAASRLLRAIDYADPKLRMPPDGPLPPAARAALRSWVLEHGSAMPARAEPSAPRRDPREFWSFQPLARPRLAESSNTSPGSSSGREFATWPRRRLDHLVLERLRAAGLAPAAEADLKTLARRASFDLTGLPPAPEVVQRLLREPEPQRAYESYVDQLLASPHYGERWGRVWLDAARYTDVTASWLESTGQAWLYRDWVVAAWNEDLPYDRFSLLQLAADALAEQPGSRLTDRAALGLLGLSPTYWKELRLAPDVIRTVVAEEWDERVDMVSRTFLGLTVACARCHDHKFDPISMEDYYALAGVFASTRLADQPLAPAEEIPRLMAARAQREAWRKELQSKPPPAAERVAELQAALATLEREHPEIDQPLAHVVEDASIYVRADGPERTRLEYRSAEPRDLPVFLRGNPETPGEVVPRRFLSVLGGTAAHRFEVGSGRLDLAQAIFREGRDLAARVIVNRIWREHFGRGLVDTPSNFGVQGGRPSHPRLLDDLALGLIDHGWSLKWLQREIVLSATYRQSSGVAGDQARRGAAVDPDNRLLWRMPRRRLDIEMWRDAMLAASAELDQRLGGPAQPLSDPAYRRRTLYGTVGRRELDDVLRLYDFPSPESHSPQRRPTTTPLQQLYVLNSPQVASRAQRLAGLVMGRESEVKERIRLAYWRLFARPPRAEELRRGHVFLSGLTADGETIEMAWQLYCQGLLGLNELMYID